MRGRRLAPNRSGAVLLRNVASVAMVIALLGGGGCQDRASHETTPSRPETEGFHDASIDSRDIGEDLRAAFKDLDPLERLSGVVQRLDATEPVELASVRAVFADPAVAPSLLEDAAFIAWWSRFDQKGPLDWALEHRRSPGIFAVLFERWGQVDPITAATILAGQASEIGVGVPDAFRNDANAALLRGWYESGKPGLFPYLAALDPRKGGIPILEDFGRYLVAKRGAEGAIDFLSSLSQDQPSLASQVLFAMAKPIARASPEAGVRLFQEHRNEPAARNLLISVAEGWVDVRGGQSAMEWVLEQKDHPRLRAAVATVFRRWIKTDREAAMAWMEPRVVEVPPELEGALVVYIGIKSEDDIVGALELRKKIREGLVRRDVTLKLLRDWRRRDADAANEWIDQTTTLSDFVRQQLAKEKEKPQLGLQAERAD